MRLTYLRRKLKSPALRTLLLALLTCCCLAACTEKEPIKLGFVGGLSGRVADLGIAGRNGAMLAVEERNLSGGVRGRRVKLMVMDDEQDPATARRAVQTLLDEGAAAIIGPMTSAMATATAPLVNEHRVPMLGPTIATEELTALDDYFFRVGSSTKTYSLKMASHLAEEKGLKTISAVYDLGNRSYTESWLNGFREQFEAMGGRVGKIQTFRSGSDVHFLELAVQAVGSGSESILIIASAMDTALLCQQIKKLAPSMPIAATGWAATEKLIELGGEAVEGIAVPQFFDRDCPDTVYVAFRESFIARFGEKPGFASVAGYDSANIALDALEKAGPKRPLKEVILDLAEFRGVQGPILFDRFGDARREAYLTTVRNGKFVVQR